jgi:hypothetical protein
LLYTTEAKHKPLYMIYHMHRSTPISRLNFDMDKNDSSPDAPHVERRSPYVFTRTSRAGKTTQPSMAAKVSSPITRASRRQLSAAGSEKLVRIRNEQARYPQGSAWPLQMRADMVAAYLDLHDTKDLCRAIGSGDAPPPTATRLIGKQTEIIWLKDAIDRFVCNRL